MAKWKCEVCGNEFENFHAQGFDNKIYCPLCYFKKENQELKKQLEENKDKINCMKTLKLIKHNNQQKEFINYLEDEINEHKNKEPFIVVNICSSYDLNEIKLKLLEETLQKYKEIIGVSDEK